MTNLMSHENKEMIHQNLADPHRHRLRHSRKLSVRKDQRWWTACPCEASQAPIGAQFLNVTFMVDIPDTIRIGMEEPSCMTSMKDDEHLQELRFQ